MTAALKEKGGGWLLPPPPRPASAVSPSAAPVTSVVTASSAPTSTDALANSRSGPGPGGGGGGGGGGGEGAGPLPAGADSVADSGAASPASWPDTPGSSCLQIIPNSHDSTTRLGLRLRTTSSPRARAYATARALRRCSTYVAQTASALANAIAAAPASADALIAQTAAAAAQASRAGSVNAARAKLSTLRALLRARSTVRVVPEHRALVKVSKPPEIKRADPKPEVGGCSASMSSSGWSAIVSGSPVNSAKAGAKQGGKGCASGRRHRQQPQRRRQQRRPRRRSRSRSLSAGNPGERSGTQNKEPPKEDPDPNKTQDVARGRSRDRSQTSRSRSRSRSTSRPKDRGREGSVTPNNPALTVTRPPAPSVPQNRTRSESQSSNRSNPSETNRSQSSAAAAVATTAAASASTGSQKGGSKRSQTITVAHVTTTATSPHPTNTAGDGDGEEETKDDESSVEPMAPAFHMPSKVDYFPGALAPPLVKLFRYVNQHRDEYINALKDIVSVRSVSSRPDCWPNVMRLLSWVEMRLKRLGAFTDMVAVPRQKAVRDYSGRPLTPPPVLLATLGQAGERRRLLVYLHVDAAPLWGSCEALAPPCELSFLDSGRTMQGRGVFECKGPLLCWLLALEALHHMHVQLPVALKFLVQGAHEIGSPGLEELLSVRRRSFLRDVDAICVTKLSWLTQCKPCVVHGLRGLVYFHLEVKAGPSNMDGGHVGGSVHEPLSDLIYLLNSLQDKSGEPAIEGLQQGVPGLSREEERHLSQVAFDCSTLRHSLGAPRLRYNENKAEVLKHRWRLPALSFHGIQGALSGAGSATGLPRAVVGKFSVRLVPKQTPERAAAAVRRHVEAAWATRHSPNHMRLTVTATARPWLESATSPHFSAARRAAKRVYKVEPDVIRDGGSMEVVLLLQRLCPRSLVVLPLGAGGGAHSAEETFRVTDFLDGIKLVASYMFEVSQVKGPKNEISIGNAYDVTKRREQAVAAAVASGKVRSITVPLTRVAAHGSGGNGGMSGGTGGGGFASGAGGGAGSTASINRTMIGGGCGSFTSGGSSCPLTSIADNFGPSEEVSTMSKGLPTRSPPEGGGTPCGVSMRVALTKTSGGAGPSTNKATPSARRPKRPGVGRRHSVTRLARSNLLVASVSEPVPPRNAIVRVPGRTALEYSKNVSSRVYGPKTYVNTSRPPIKHIPLANRVIPMSPRMSVATPKTASSTKAPSSNPKLPITPKSKAAVVKTLRSEAASKSMMQVPVSTPGSAPATASVAESLSALISAPSSTSTGAESSAHAITHGSRHGLTGRTGRGAARHKRRPHVAPQPKTPLTDSLTPPGRALHLHQPIERHSLHTVSSHSASPLQRPLPPSKSSLDPQTPPSLPLTPPTPFADASVSFTTTVEPLSVPSKTRDVTTRSRAEHATRTRKKTLK